MFRFGHFATTQEFTFKTVGPSFSVFQVPDHRQPKANTHTLVIVVEYVQIKRNDCDSNVFFKRFQSNTPPKLKSWHTTTQE